MKKLFLSYQELKTCKIETSKNIGSEIKAAKETLTI